ncbi:MAG: DUF459 domain-containing protein [Kiritimatiellia bacterium]
MTTNPRPLLSAVLLLAVGLAAPALGQAQPERVAFVGDSMMKLIGHQGNREMSKLPGVTVVTNFVSLGSGLARLDAFDWMAKFDSVMKETRPTLVIIALGTNDKQPMATANGHIVRPGEPAWAPEYGRRVGQAMDILLTGGAARVYWLELPDMKDPRHQADANEINAVVREQAAARPAVTFFETRVLLSRKPGEYTKFRIGPTGKPIEIRDVDGIHLSRAGADLVVQKLIAALLAKPD